MLIGSITFPVGPWLWPAAITLVSALVLLLWSYRRAPIVGASQVIAFFLKILGISVLLFCLIEPLWNSMRAKSGANLFVVVADNSSGMNIQDQDQPRSRGEILRTLLTDDNSNWQAVMADNFQVRQYVFDSRLRRTMDFSELVFDGKASAIGSTLRTIAERYRGRPLAGVLLLTDGIATDVTEKFYDLADLPPVYPVVIGSARPQRDISITNTSVSQTSFEDAPVTVQADVETSGFAGKTIEVDLLDSSGQTAERQIRKISKSSDKQNFAFRLRPNKTGILFYNLSVSEKPDDKSSPNRSETLTNPSNGLEQTEATMVNNKRTLVVDRGQGPYRILYVTGRPNWEYKFLQRAVSEDEQLELVGLIRAARREPKYDFRGRAGESSNPLYRGFDIKDAEQTEQYDQPVLVRLNVRSDEELRDGFPRTAEELFVYHAIILDDIESEFFSFDQMDLIRRFVSERGGGFFMLGGKESFRQGGFDRTPIGSILPVYLDRIPQANNISSVFFNLTREGWLQPWARLSDNEQDELQRLLEMPEFQVLNRVRDAKPGARIIATVGDEVTYQLPALVVQRFGNGRSAALTIGDIWRWGLKWPEMRDDMNKFWRQTLRWLVADVPERITLLAEQKTDQANQPIVFRISVRGKDFEPMDNVSVAVEISSSGQEILKLTAEPVPNEIGVFEAVYIPRDNGSYIARAVVTDADGFSVGDAQTGLAVDLDALELRSITTNRPLLEKIARQTGGQVVDIEGLNDFVKYLPNRKAPVTEFWVRPLWDLPGILPAVFLFVLMCFIGEWALRRWKGMP